MIESKNMNKIKYLSGKGQAIAEFAIALPILLLILVGLFEVGRMVFIYSAVTNGSRNAVRYASAVGLGSDGLTKYNNCAVIKKIAEDSAYLAPVTSVVITYDDGTGVAISGDSNCDVWIPPAPPGSVDTGINVSSGDRVTVQVTAQYKPMVSLIPFTTRDIVSTNSRTIFGIIDLPNTLP